MDLEELEKHVILMEDIQEIENLQMIYGYYFETQQNEEIVALFSEENTESVEITDHSWKTFKVPLAFSFVTYHRKLGAKLIRGESL